MLHLGSSAAVKDVFSQFTGEISQFVPCLLKALSIWGSSTFSRRTVRQGAFLPPILCEPQCRSHCRELRFCTNPASVGPRHISVALCPDQHRHRATHCHNWAGNSEGFFCAMWQYCLAWEERGRLSKCCCFYIFYFAKDFIASQQHKSQLTLLLVSSFLWPTAFKMEEV